MCASSERPPSQARDWQIRELVGRPTAMFRTCLRRALVSSFMALAPFKNGEGLVSGPELHPRIWVNRVPEPKSAKHRVHLDIYTTDLARLETLGSRILLPEGDGRRWTVMADPESGEYCAFLRADLPERRLHGLVVDSADPPVQARWWAEVYGARVVHDSSGFSTGLDVA